MRRNKWERGVTVVEVVAVLFLALVVGAMLIGCWAPAGRARKAARRMECASRMRQIGLALFQYEKRFLCLPNAQWNVWKNLDEYLGAGERLQTTESKVTEVFRCPSDEYLSDDDLWNAVSYAPLVDSGYIDGDDDGVPDGNVEYCAWSYCQAGYDVGNDGPGDTEDKVWTLRNLVKTGPDTIILTEFWAATNRLNLDKEHPAGYLLYNWSEDPGDSGDLTGQGGTLNFGGPAVVASGRIADAHDVGGYAFLSQFAHEAAQKRRSRKLDDICHDGAINLMRADGAVIAYRLKEITHKSPKDIPMWTRIAD